MTTKKTPASKGAGSSPKVDASAQTMPAAPRDWARVEAFMQAERNQNPLFLVDPDYVHAIRAALEQGNFKLLLQLLRHEGIDVPGIIHPALLPLLAEVILPLAKRKGSAGARRRLSAFDDANIRRWFVILSSDNGLGRKDGKKTVGDVQDFIANAYHVDRRTIIRSLNRSALTKPPV